jgi:hypothetical protein
MVEVEWGRGKKPKQMNKKHQVADLFTSGGYKLKCTHDISLV